MARIRSIHPGQWTDDEFVSMSMAARLLAIAIRNEADDRGCFEWKPLRLKMRLFPGDDVDMGRLLGELQANNQIMQYEVDGKTYGAIRNFCAFQRPKKPSYHCPTTELVNDYTDFNQKKARRGEEPDEDEPPQPPNRSRTSSPPVPHQFPTGREKSPQKGGREEGRKGIEGREQSPAAAADPTAARASQPPPPAEPHAGLPQAPPPVACSSDDQALGDEIAGILGATGDRWAWSGLAVHRWRQAGASPDLIRAVARGQRQRIDANGKRPPVDPKYLDGPMSDAIAAGQAPMPPPGQYPAQQPPVRIDVRAELDRIEAEERDRELRRAHP